MLKSCKRIGFILLLCLLSTSLFATYLKWNWESQDENIAYYCYRLNDSEEWNIVKSDVTSIYVPNYRPNTPYTIELASSFDGIHWSDSVLKTFITPKEKRLILRFKLSGASFGIYDFINGHEVEDAKYLTVTDPGMGLGFDLGYLVTKKLELNLGYKFAFFAKKETVLPKALMVTNHIVKAGVNYRIPLTTSAYLATGIDAGALFALNAKTYSIAPLLGVNVGFDLAASDSLIISFSTGCSFVYNHSDDKLYRSMSYLLDGVTFSIEKRL